MNLVFGSGEGPVVLVMVEGKYLYTGLVRDFHNQKISGKIQVEVLGSRVMG